MNETAGERPSPPLPPPAAPAPAAAAPSRGLLVMLMAMTSIGPTALNILVPALPELAREFATDTAVLQLTVSLFLVGLAVAQLVMGPLSDRFGRRPVLLAGMALTAASSVLAIAVATVESLIVARILQAIGASTGIVVGRAIIRDLYDRSRAASVLGLVATVMVAVPSAAPLIGGLLDVAFGWPAIFVFVAATSLAMLAWIAAVLPETRSRPAADAPREGFRRDLRVLGASAPFYGYVLIASFGTATYFAFLGGGPYLVIDLMARSPAEYGLWFVGSSLGYMAGNFAASRLALRHGVDRLIGWGIGTELAGAVLAVGLAATVPDCGPAIVFVPQAIIAFGNGLLLPGAISGAVSIRPQAAGTAAGVLGFTQMALGAAVAQYGAILLAGATSALPLALFLLVLAAACAAAAALLARRS